MANSLTDELFFKKSKDFFIFDGTDAEVAQLKELMRLIVSTPSGKELLKDIVIKGNHPQISFASNFENIPGQYLRGRFERNTYMIEVLKIDTNLPEMSQTGRIESKIMMATVLAHELQHCADVLRNNLLDKNARTPNELMLAEGLCEMSAYMKGDQINKELRSNYGLLKKIIVNGKEYTEDVKPRSATDRKKAMDRALSGNNPHLKKYMTRKCQELVIEPTASAAVFRQNVQHFLQELNVPMSFEEALICVGQCTKLLPMAKTRKMGER